MTSELRVKKRVNTGWTESKWGVNESEMESGWLWVKGEWIVNRECIENA